MAPTEVLARQHHQTLRRLAAPAGVEIGLLDRARKGPGARFDAGEPRLRADPDRRRDARALAARCRVPRPRAGRDRRAASLWCRAAPRARRQGPRRRHAADERDADPAHADDDRLWRSRRLAPDRKAAGPAAGRYPHRAARPRRGGHRRVARAFARGAKVFWVCPMVEESENADIAAAEERYNGAGSRCCRAGSGWCTAA